MKKLGFGQRGANGQGCLDLRVCVSPKIFLKIHFQCFVEQMNLSVGPQSSPQAPPPQDGRWHLPPSVSSRTFLIHGHLASAYTLVVT